MKVRHLLLGAALILPFTSFAEKKRRKSLHDEFTGQQYGKAGCGLGSVVFGNKPGGVQILAATTNNFPFPQTFAISSGTSNCVDPKSKEGLVSYIRTNQNGLESEAAKGSGETLAGLNDFVGCENPNELNQHLQKNFNTIFSKDGASQVTDNLIRSIQNEPTLNASCDMRSLLIFI